MVGGKVVENTVVRVDLADSLSVLRRRLWCVDGTDECAVYVEDTPESASVEPGDTCWWQGGLVYARNDTLTLKKVGFSFDPRPKAR